MAEKDVKIEDGQKVLKDKVDEYKRTHPEKLPEIDFAFLIKTLKKMNESSPIKVARNAFNEKREWIPGTETWNIGKVYLSEDHCVTFTLSKGDKVMTIESIEEELNKIDKALPLKNVPIKLEISGEKTVQITDIYAHSLVASQWAGMPVDYVLCYNQSAESKKHEPVKSEE